MKCFFTPVLLLFFCSCSFPKQTTVRNLSKALRPDGFYYPEAGDFGRGGPFLYLFENGVAYRGSYLNSAAAKRNSVNSGFGFWASYTISQDTILIRRQLFGAGHRIYEDRGRILNDSTFYISATREYPRGKFMLRDKPEYYHFGRSEIKPDSTNMFYRDEKFKESQKMK